MRRQPDLMIDGLLLPVHAAGAIEQTFEDFGAFSTLRLGLGAAVHQEVWRKVRTSLSATGLIPPGLDSVDWSQSHTLGCVAARSVQSATPELAIPAGRRSDAPPYGFALMPAGRLVPVAVDVAGDVATLATVAGADGYQVLWYPLMTVIAPDGLRTRFDARGAVAGWDLVAEEI